VASPKKDVALLQIAVSAAIGSSAVCLQWSTGRALAAGATKDEITDVPPGDRPRCCGPRATHRPAAVRTKPFSPQDIERAHDRPDRDPPAAGRGGPWSRTLSWTAQSAQLPRHPKRSVSVCGADRLYPL